MKMQKDAPSLEKDGEKRKIKSIKYRLRQKSTSIYFLLWTVFSALCFFIICLFAVMQRVVMVHTYKNGAAEEVFSAGQNIQQAVEKPLPPAFNGSWSAYLNFLSGYYGVNAYLVTAEGEIVFPRNPEVEQDPEENRAPSEAHLQEILQNIQREMQKDNASFALFEGDGEFVYGAEVSLFGDSVLYLYVSEPLQLLDAAMMQMNVRIILIGVFVFVLAFAVSSAVAAWLIKPIFEMRDKARLLAKGDFRVDFHGNDYGQELVELADSLNFARDELAKTDRMQKELIANVSHDFKTPLTMIKAYAAMIKEISGDQPQKREKHAQIIIDEADRLATLVEDLLDLSKLRAGLSALKIELVDMSSYTREILDRFAYLKDTQGYEFIEDIEENLWTSVDASKIGQAIYNLIGNAVNYTGEDKKVFVSLKRAGENTFRLCVKDTGAGINKEELAHIWERYYRSADTHKRPVKGTGLGLSVVKAVLERHNLVFGVESEEGKGSAFYIVFECAQTQSEE